MKKNLYGILLITSIILTACSQSRNMGSSYTDEPSNSISYQQFYDDLSPYGQWIDNPDFGYVWSPRINGFRPYYSNGHWAYTDYGWTWVSGYDWGWAPFHYGRWFHDSFNGWMWVPGNEWAPAWVSWRQNPNYYGWAPLCPQRRNGSYYDIQNDQWAFVPNRYINRRDLNNYYINNQNNITIINNTTVINNPRVNNGTQYQEGPSVAEVEKITNAKIRRFPVKQSAVPGDSKLQSGALHIYKPEVKQNTITANAGESKPVLSKNVFLPNQPQVNDGRAKNSRINDVSKKRLNEDLNNSNSTPASRRRLATRNNNQADNDPNSQKTIQNLPPETNTNSESNNDKRRRVFRNSQQRDNADEQQNPGNIRPNPVIQRREINRDNNSNNSSQRVFVNPSRSSPAKINQEERLNDQQRPEINQRQFKTTPNPASERPSNFEKRIQPTPQNAPGNLNRENIGIRKLRNN